MPKQAPQAQPTRITVVDRTQKRVAIQITEISFDERTGRRKKQGHAHLTVYGVNGEQAKQIIADAFKAAEKNGE